METSTGRRVDNNYPESDAGRKQEPDKHNTIMPMNEKNSEIIFGMVILFFVYLPIFIFIVVKSERARNFVASLPAHMMSPIFLVSFSILYSVILILRYAISVI